MFGRFKSLAKELDEIFEIFNKHSLWMWEWKEINEVPAGKCAKCGSTDLRLTYITDKDKLRKRCSRCAHCWDEEPLDKKKEK